MARYRIEYTREAEKQLDDLDRQVAAQVVAKIDRLADQPRPPGYKLLVGRSGYRIRVRDYRVIYTVRDDQLLVLVIQIGHRREVYR